jgi:uncharacterized Zn-finger protein
MAGGLFCLKFCSFKNVFSILKCMHCNCIGLQVVFPSQSQLRRHEKESHLNLRPHTCGICAARFDRVSQLSYHQRRIHAGERGHACQICHKVGMVYNEIKFRKHGVSSF